MALRFPKSLIPIQPIDGEESVGVAEAYPLLIKSLYPRSDTALGSYSVAGKESPCLAQIQMGLGNGEAGGASASQQQVCTLKKNSI